jgi:hypothetical protein
MQLQQFYYKRNRLQQLKRFGYVRQIGNISKAAEKMGLSKSISDIADSIFRA